MSRFFNRSLDRLVPYTPGEQPQDQQYVKLNTNESPYPPSPGVIAALNAREAADLRLYSDPEAKVLKAVLAERYSVEPANIFVGNGSDEALNFAFLAYAADGRGAAFADITYGFYPVFAELYHIPVRIVPLKEDFTLDPEDYYGLHRTIVIANPNAPTGLALSRAQVEGILQANPDCVVVLDEAYVDFGGESCVSLTGRYPNLLVVQTYSKSRSMAGARLGYAIGDAALIQDLELDTTPLLHLIEGCRSDICQQQPLNRDELLDYTYCVACCVGLTSARIMGAGEAAYPYAIALGHALQMVNIIRDVAEDCGKSNRIYLPREDMDRFGYTLEDLRGRVYSPQLQELLQYEADLAEKFFAEAEEEYNRLSPEDKAALIPAQAMALIYHTILDKMKAGGFRIFDIRYRVNTFHKLWLLFRTKLDIDPQSYYDKSKAYYDKLVGFLSRPGRKDEK